ncbi:hypothetical protein P3S67_010057 [Capsicum chacoense]
MKCLQDLIDRCLVLVGKKSLDETKIRSCKVHDLVYDLCLRELQRGTIFIRNDIVFEKSDVNPLLSKCQFLSSRNMKPFKRWTYDEIHGCHYGLYKALLTPVHCQLTDEDNNNILKQTGSVDKGRHWDFPNIQTISCLSPSCCTKEVISRIQNIKKLGIRGDKVDYEIISSAKVFPETLKKLKLYGTNLSWSYLDIISELPNLEVLKLMPNAYYGGEWYPIVRGFNRLKLLLVKNSDLQFWKATNDNFPILERLMLTHCLLLFGIPIEFADIHSLQLIELRDCLPELGESAARIQQEQEELGKNPVDVRIIKPFHSIINKHPTIAYNT